MGGPELFCFKRSAIGSQKGLGSATGCMSMVRILQPWISGEEEELEGKQRRWVLVQGPWTGAFSCDQDAWVLLLNFPVAK